MADTEIVASGDEEDVIVELDEDVVEAEDTPEPDSKAEKPAAEESEEDEDEEGPEGHAGETDEERRLRRAAARKRKRENARQDKEAMQREIAELRRVNADVIRRMENVDKRMVHQDTSQVDAALNAAAHSAREAEQEIAAAVAAGDGMAVVEAQRKWYQSARAAEQLTEIKKRVTAQPAPQKGVDPVLQANFQAWSARNTWYDATVKGVDSKIAFAVDSAMAEEGWDPRRPEYWDELDNRLKERLPHRYKPSQAPQEQSSRPRPPTGGTPKNSTLKPNQIRLSPERVQAMKDAGVWDDPEARKRYVKRYAEYDKAHKGD